MTNLLHLDSSLNGERSVSREITGAYAAAWRAANPDGGYRHRDLAAQPPEHLATLPMTDDGPVHDDLRWADVVLIGAPMYNLTVPSTLKAWLDHICVVPFFVDRETGVGPVSGKKVVVATARGGSYAPGTPREAFDFQAPFLRAVLAQIGLDQDLTFVHTEMTRAAWDENLAQFRDLAVTSHENALKTVQRLATG